MVAARDLRGWVLPYGLVMGGVTGGFSRHQEASPLADWPILRFDRVRGVLVLSTVEPIDAVGFETPGGSHPGSPWSRRAALGGREGGDR